MAQYFWNAPQLNEAVILPARIADELLTTATPQQLRVLLWLSRHHMNLDTSACGAALGLSPAEVQACLQYWEQQQILLPAADSDAPAKASMPLARPAPVKPQMREVLDYQRHNPEFATLVQSASARLGKAISHADTATLLYLLDTVGLPMEVILTEIAYAVSIGKPNMRYIEKIALEWADQELTSLEDVDAHIRYLERCRQAALRLETLLELSRPLNTAQSQLAEKWLDQWHFRDDMLRRAAEITREKTDKFSPAYMDRILERWQAEGIDRPEKIPASAKAKKGPAATNPEQSSLDLEGFEEALMRYTPVFKNKEK